MKFNKVNSWAVGISFGMIIMTGCGTVDTRTTVEQLTNARIAVEAAEKAGSKMFAEENLRQGQDALAIAKDAYANKAFERAFDFAKKATIYARIASAQTDYRKSEKKLNALKEQLEKVREQTQSLMKPAKSQQVEGKIDQLDRAGSSKAAASQPVSTTLTPEKTPALVQGGTK